MPCPASHRLQGFKAEEGGDQHEHPKRCLPHQNVEELLILSNKADTIRLEFVDITLDTADAEEGFSALARALSPTSFKLGWVLVQGREATEQLLQARSDDLRTIIESLTLAG